MNERKIDFALRTINYTQHLHNSFVPFKHKMNSQQSFVLQFGTQSQWETNICRVYVGFMKACGISNELNAFDIQNKRKTSTRCKQNVQL